MKSISIDRTNGICGLAFIATGLFFIWQAASLEIPPGRNGVSFP